ncbi:glycogen debranching protein GlgX [Niveibacterium umoris]|uniref:Glycogen operon protein n=1 Tax=Niveibacterium umoris TaxID=1193620 RepID=A0A840BPP9_9RHOO|nr:glycogen debranching protein GlgX [Niveibacterium umoris]MBB4014603.1 glycogen operon protein [Niveibacterium umoris]
MAATPVPPSPRNVLPGRWYPLGATPEPGGVNFALYSRHATRVFLHLFDEAGGSPSDILELTERDRYVWHGFVPGLKPGQLYGFKVDGAIDSVRGLRFNPHKLLLDPYARAISGKPTNPGNLLLAYDPASPLGDLSLDTRDNSAVMPKGIVVDPAFDWGNDTPPMIPFEQLVIYETHVKGFTADPASGAKQRGTYLGFIEKIPYLKELGVNAVELLPVHAFHVEDFLGERGLTNYWGYNTLAFFAPEPSYGTGRAPGCEVTEFKTLVRALHQAGIEVILDVVYNHSAEGNEHGPTLSLRGIDNPSYYTLTGPEAEPNRYYVNTTGCGNSLNFASPAVIKLVMDSLRYWVEEMHVDGFRFDLASVLGREESGFQRTGAFFDAVGQDPVLSRVKLIAEPWDLGTYQVGNFPVDWSEWNGRFRDTLRKFTKGDGGLLGELGRRLTGSSDLYGDDGRSAFNSVNFITCHDGFTLNDLVSYNGKHNEANQEGNRDGSDDNSSWNCGAEGPTNDAEIERLRGQMIRNHLCALLFAMGTPMLLGGDEVRRTQHGNNNAYCQDNAIGWFDWSLVQRHADLFTFTRRAIAFTRRYTVLQRRKFLIGQDMNCDGVADITWYGTDLNPPRWDDPQARTLCYRLDGGEIASAEGRYYLFLILNADPATQWVKLPPAGPGMHWYRVVDTSLPPGEDFAEEGKAVPLSPEDSYIANGRSTVMLIAR